MKKQFTLFLFVVLAMFGMKANADEVLVGSAYEFLKAVEDDASANIRLTADIDMTGQSTIDKAFSGTICGQGFDEKGDPTAYRFTNVKQPIFAKLSNATVCRVGFTGCDIFFKDGDNENYGAVLAMEATGSHFDNIILIDVHVFVENDYAAALVAKASNCTFEGIICKNCRVNNDGQYAGAVTAYAEGTTFTGCTMAYDSKVFSDGSFPDAYAGSIAGYASGCTLTDCLNMGLVGGDNDRVGGFVGYATNNTSIRQCQNAGVAIQIDEEGFDELYSSYLKSIMDALKAQGIEGGFDDTAWDWGITKTVAASGGAAVAGLGLAATLFFLNVGSTSAFVEGVVLGGLVTGGVALVVAVVALVALPPVAFAYIALNDHDELGGIVGCLENGSQVVCCTNNGAVVGPDSYVGGIVGLATNASVNSCLNTGVVQGDDNTGGIVGDLQSSSSLTDCLNTGEIKGDSPWGLIYGDKDSDAITYNNYVKGESYADGGNGTCVVTERQLETGMVGYWLNEAGSTGCWRQDYEKDVIPTLDQSREAVTVNNLSKEILFEVSEPQDLAILSERVNKYGLQDVLVYLTDDINMDKWPYDYSEPSYSFYYWEPIGNEEHPFRGIFCGNGHKISNISCVDNKRGVGLLGSVDAHTAICDLQLENCSISSTDYAVGSFVGRVKPSMDNAWVIIDGCSSNEVSLTGLYNVGGIVGCLAADPSGTRLLIRNSSFNGTITATGTSSNSTTGVSAFIVGYAGKKATIESCYSWASFSSNDDYDTGMAFARAATNGATLRNCYQIYHSAGGVSTPSSYQQNGVGNFTTDDARRGILAYKLNGNTNDVSKGLRWEQNIYNDMTSPRVVPIGQECKGVYYTRNVKNTIGTIVLPYDVASNDDITYYTLMGANADGTLGFESVDVLPAGTPAIFRTASTGTRAFTDCGSSNFGYTNHDVSQGDWTMKGNFCEPGTDLFFLSEFNDMSRLYYISGGQVKQATNSLTVDPLRAYLEGPASSGAKSIAIRLDGGDATTIEWTECSDEVDANANVNANIYNLQGQQVGNGYKGIVILNGKKVLMK